MVWSACDLLWHAFLFMFCDEDGNLLYNDDVSVLFLIMKYSLFPLYGLGFYFLYKTFDNAYSRKYNIGQSYWFTITFVMILIEFEFINDRNNYLSKLIGINFIMALIYTFKALFEKSKQLSDEDDTIIKIEEATYYYQPTDEKNNMIILSEKQTNTHKKQKKESLPYTTWNV